MNCPNCGHKLDASTAAQILRAKKTPARARASRENGKLGGRPKKAGAKVVITSTPRK